MQINTSVNIWSTEVIDCCYELIEKILLTCQNIATIYTLTLKLKCLISNHNNNYAYVYVNAFKSMVHNYSCCNYIIQRMYVCKQMNKDVFMYMHNY